MTSLKKCSIISFCAAKPSTISTKRKPLVIVVNAYESPDRAVIIAANAATEKSSRLVDAVLVVDGEFVLVSFHVREI